ncbi:MAG: DUF6516 family protein [Chloroflexi bacterium]|nr:DUF6516 family protein [Chloroflexota bacterium]
MKVADYFETIREQLVIVSFVADFKIIKQVDRSKNGHVRARVTFTDDSRLEFSEFIEQNANEEIQVVTYSYHWVDQNETLLARWDNTPHFPKLENFPHHVHKNTGDVVPGQPVDIFGVLAEIEKTVGQ